MYSEQNAHRLPRADACASAPLSGALIGKTASEIGAAQPRDVSEVERELNRLANVNDQLHGVIAELVERLRPVLAPRPEAAGGNCAEPGACSPLGSIVQGQRNRAQDAVNRLSELIQSLAI